MLVVGGLLVGQFVQESASLLGSMDKQVLHVLQASEMHLQLRVAPLGLLTHVTATEAIIDAIQALLLAGVRHHDVDQVQKPAGLGRQFIQGPAQHFMGKLVGDGDVVRSDFDVLDLLALMFHGLHLTLVLVQESHSTDQRQVLGMVTSSAGFIIQEGEMLGIGIGDQQGLQEPLGVTVDGESTAAILSRQAGPPTSAVGVVPGESPSFVLGLRSPSGPGSGS